MSPGKRPRRHGAILRAAAFALSLLPAGLPGLPAAPVASAQTAGFQAESVDLGLHTGPTATGDLDGDGKLDIVIGVARLFDNGGLSFGSRPASGEDSFPVAGDDVLVADANADGDLDVIFGSNTSGLLVYLNQGRAVFPLEPSTVPGSAGSRRIAGGDLDGDGDIDLVSTANGGQAFLNAGDGSFAPFGGPIYTPDLTPGLAPELTDVAVGDFDNDGSLDVVFAGNKDPGLFTPARVFLGDGRGAFTPGLALNPAGNISSAVAAGDVTGDGVPEIILVNKAFPMGVIPNFSEPGLTLVYNYAGQSPTTPIAALDPQNAGTSVALGDIDGNGALDIVVGTEPSVTIVNPGLPVGGAASMAFLNLGPNTFGAPQVVNPAGAQTTALAVADLDGDQALDVVLSNRRQGEQGSTGHLNARGFTLGGDFFELAETAVFPKVVAADIAGDGRRDLVYGGAGALIGYFTNGGNNQGLPTSTGFRGDFQVGDMTGDGHLDLVVAGAPFGLLVNDGQGGLSPGGAVVPPGPEGTLVVADFTRDGPLDVAVIAGAQIRLYVNDGSGRFTAGPVSEAVAPAAVALGDIDGDRAPDLVLATGSSFDTYVNDGTGRFAIVAWLNHAERATKKIGSGAIPNGTPIQKLVLGELNGDGLFDVVATTNTFNYIFFSDRLSADLERPGELRGASAPLNAERQDTVSAAIGDLNGDGVPDLATASFRSSSPFQVVVGVDAYLNDGRGAFTRVGSLQPRILPITRSNTDAADLLALGDVTGDGLDDIIVAGPYTNATVFRSRRQRVTAIGDTPPAVAVGTPSSTRLAEGYVSPERSAGIVAIPFSLFDAEGDPVTEVLGEYSLDGGGSWTLVDNLEQGNERRNLSASPQGAPHVFRWDLAAFPEVFGQSDTVRFRITALHTPRPRQPPFGGGRPAPSLAGPLQYAGQRGVSPLFRVRGSIARVVSAARPGGEAGALVYKLRYDPFVTGPNGLPLTRAGGEQPLPSDGQGYVPSWDSVDERLVAVLPVSTTGRLTYAFTSPIPDPDDVAEGQSGVTTLTVSQASPLLLLNLTVSLEWEATSDRAYLDQLRANLLRSSQLLYDWSDGQVALGAVRLYTDKALWETADVQVYASNSLRPNATQGGVVLTETTRLYTVDGQPSSVTYEPGHIRMGATWSGEGDPGRASGEDWARALAHEIGHYFFFLDETYLGREGDLLVPVEGCLSPMSDPYIDSASEFRPRSAWGGPCLNTLQHRTTGLSEWELIKRTYDRPGIAPGWDFVLNEPGALNANPGPSALPLQVTTFEEFLYNGLFPNPRTTASYGLLREDGQRYEPSASARALLFTIVDLVSGAPKDIVDLGVPGSSQVLARGIYPSERVCVFDPEQELAGCRGVSGDVRLRSLPGWRPEVRVTPDTRLIASGFTSMTLMIEVPAASVAPPSGALPPLLGARLYPRSLTPEEDAAIQLRQISLSLEGDGPAAVYRGTFDALPAIVEEGYIYIFAAEVSPIPEQSVTFPDGSGREYVTDFAIGGNPAPKKKPPRRSRRRAPAVSPDGQATLFSEDTSFATGQFYTLQTVSSLPEPPPWASVVSQGYRLIASDPALLASPDKPLALSIGYAEGGVPPGLEGGVRMIFDDGAGWRELPTRLNTSRNEAAVTVQPTPGVYALVTSLRLPLTRPGWHLLFSYPGATQPLPAALAGAGASYRMAYAFDAEDEGDPWKLYAPGVPAQWAPLVNDLAELRAEQSYWLYVTEAITVPVRAPGDEPEPQLGAARLAAGSALDQPPATVYGVVPGVPAGAGLTVAALVGEAECGATTTAAHTIDGAPQAAFSLNIVSDSPDTPGCGRDGAIVDLEVRRGAVALTRTTARWDNTRVGQVSFGQGSGLVFLPVVGLRARGEVSAEVDLAVTGIEVVPATPRAGQPAEVRVTITNRGAEAVTRSFWVDLYVDPEGPPPGGLPWTELSEFGVSWRVYRLEPGASLVLSSLRPDDPLNPGQSYSNFRGFGAPATYTLYARVDSFEPDGAPEGVVFERDEGNNRLGPLTVEVRQ